jgi:hypothetical protein
MLDFLIVSTRPLKGGVVEIYPKFVIKKSKDLMIRGGDFYAIWIEELGLWSTDEQDALRLIDKELDKYVEENKHRWDSHRISYMWDAESGMIDKWHRYCQKQCRDNFNMLDENIIFSNAPVRKEDYASRRLSYPLESCDVPTWDKIVGTLYTPEERHKIEWAIGAIVSGDSKHIQKFMVFYGSPGSGKSTILDIIQDLFDGYCAVFDAKALASSSNSFALEAFKTNPLVAIQHDGDLSKIEDNTRINSLVSHELMTVNEKFKSTYSNRFKAFLFLGTNKPVKITDSKSGLIRRLIDVTPSGNTLSRSEYNQCIKQVRFELGGIAKHCESVYLKDKYIYDSYIPVAMLGSTNDFYNFIEDSYFIFKEEDGVTLKSAWEMYKTYCEDAKVAYPYPLRAFKEELKSYFHEFKERTTNGDVRLRNYYRGFRVEKFENKKYEEEDNSTNTNNIKLIDFKNQDSIFDKEYANCMAQYATDNGTPFKKWDDVKTKLSKINTSEVHYVKVPENHIVIDFDIKNSKGEKDAKLNISEASTWPPTYAELSKSGSGVHLHYIYNGDVSKLSRVYDENIEVKVFTGNSSLRRKLTKCNNLPIATISSGLPLKSERMVDFDTIKNEKALRTLIKRNLNKEIHPATKPSMDFINKLLDDAYASGINYDVTDMRNAILAFAVNSSNQSDYCVKLVNKMKFKSENVSDNISNEAAPIVIYDVEVFPNLFLVNWKIYGKENSVIRMINPKPSAIEDLIKYRLVGFNCRRYDNHILYAALMGYTNEQLFNLSQKIINGSSNAFFSEAYNLSYTDVYDFASAGNKKSLKKWEIELGLKHHELGLPWDQPVPEEKWIEVAEYCDDDVLATEAVFDHLSADWTARQILAELAGMSVNDTTNTLTTRIIFGNNKKPQHEFIYRDLALPVHDITKDLHSFLKDSCPSMMSTKHGDKKSLLPYFPGYVYEGGKSTYKGEDVGEGGFVYAEPGMYGNVALLDVASMHPHSAIAECLFGIRYTQIFKDIVDGRVCIKHEDWEALNNMLDGKLTPYVQRIISGEMKSKDLANGLKTAINSVYGLTSANFDNPFRDIRNKDNIVAKRGALFMIDLKEAVMQRGFIVAHIKTDSIKIPDATPEIIQFVMEFGERYGYTFEHEATYDKMCLVNDAVYIAKYATPEKCRELYGYVPGDCNKSGGEWTATGTQFAVPYVFKTLFSKEPYVFEDMCETKSVTTAIYLDKNEDLPDISEYEKELEKATAKHKKDMIPTTVYEQMSAELNEKISTGHNYIFIGKVGQFTPILPGKGGALLVREKDGKYYAVGGSKGYRWLESEMVKEMGKENDIDKSYYNSLVDEAIVTIGKYGDVEWFCSDEPYIENVHNLSFNCQLNKNYETCSECPRYHNCKLIPF